MDFCPTVKIWGMCPSCPHPADTPMPDEISARLLKETAEQIAPSLTLLYNKSLETGVFPDEWKLANIVPIHKKDNKDHVDNYRPISLLSIISKVLERCFLIRLRDHLLRILDMDSFLENPA